MSVTVGQVIEQADEIKPNAFSEETKTRWLNECEGMVQTQVLLMLAKGCVTYRWPEDKDTELLVQPPHDKLYEAYLTAKIDFANGEYNKYANSMQMFNEFFSEFMRWFALVYQPGSMENWQPSGYPDGPDDYPKGWEVSV